MTVVAPDGSSLHANGRSASFDIADWHRLVEAAQGDSLELKVRARVEGRWLEYAPFPIYVSQHELKAWGLTYRRIAPGYEIWSKMGLYQRSLADFSESAIFENSSIAGGCVNCHNANRTDPSSFVFHVRGPHGATLVQREGKREWLNTKTDETLGFCVYPYWHPSGRYVAFSTNQTNQAFHAVADERVEVFDHASDVQIYDVERHELLLTPLLKTDDWMESYPVFSPDGKTLYYCTSRQYADIAADYKKIRYNICAISFDEETGTFGQQVDTLIRADAMGKSAVHPRPSYDGRYLMYTLCDYGCFPIWHEESDQWLLDLESQSARPMDEVNSAHADSYHNWSIDSHWFVFTSRRDDGLHSRLYIASIDDDGHISKPFMLPQRRPKKYNSENFFSYNTPDFTLRKVSFNKRAASGEVLSAERKRIGVRPGWNHQPEEQ